MTQIKPFINNQVNCSLYIGRNAGKIIENYISNATKSVKILSPYVGHDLIDLLMAKQREGVDVKLISSGKNNDFYNPQNSLLLKKLISQHCTVDEDAKTKRKSLYSFKLYLICVFISYVIISIILLSTKTTNLFTSTWYVYIILIIAIFFIQSEVESIKIYNYNYSTPFFVKFINDPELFLHYKLYIIDDSKAFVGSLNFSNSGFFSNYETCITIDDKNIIKELSEYFDYIARLNCRQIELTKYGPIIYKEPKN